MKRHVLITGGSRGIGAAAVEVFARSGDHVSFFYKREHKKAEELVQKMTDEEKSVFAYAVDITNRKSFDHAIQEIEKDRGTVDIFISNAGIALQGLLTDVSEVEYRLQMDTHLTSLFYGSQAVLPGMIAKKKGCILAVSSIWGITGASCEVVYSAAKAGVNGFVKALAKEVGPSGITVNAIAPGMVDTDMMADFNESERIELQNETPLGRFGEPGEIAELLYFLASKNAEFITGQIISPNGGIVM